MGEDTMLESILHSKKTKYIVLDQILKKHIKPECENVNIFIDINSILKTLYQPSILEIFNSLNVKEKYLISSEILNIAAHYRHYFYSRIGKYTTFYYYMSSEKCQSLLNIFPGYKKDIYNKYLDLKSPVFGNINTLLSKNLKIAFLISEYLPHIYMIDTKEVESNIVPYHFIRDEDPEKDMSIIITDDIVQFQSVLFNPSTIIMTPKGDRSEIITQDNLMEQLTKTNKTHPEHSLINEFYPHILSMAGHKRYSIDGVSRFGNLRTIKFFNDELSKGNISNLRYDSMESLTNSLDISESHKKIMNRNFKLLDIKTIYNFSTTVGDRTKLIDDRIFNRIDAKSLRYMNDKYFQVYPLDLEYLMEGEDYS